MTAKAGKFSLFNIENKIRGTFRVPTCINGCNVIVLGAITIKFGMIKHKKMLPKTVKKFFDLFQVLLLFLELEMSKMA